MHLVATSRWIGGHLLRHPLVWLWTALLTALWPVVAFFTPLGLTTSAGTEVGALYEIAFLSLLVGHLAGMALLAAGGWFLESVPPARRLATELVALSTSAALFTGASLGAAWALGAPRAAFAPTSLPWATLVAHLHLAGVALILLRLPLSPPVMLVGLPLAVWVLPAGLGGAGPLGALVDRALGVGRHLAFPWHGDPAGTHWGTSLLPIIGWLGAAYLVRCPATHALRDPR